MHLHELQKEVDTWIKSKGVRYFDELSNMVILTEEVGELASLMVRIYGEQSFKEPITKETERFKIADEMADILFVLICLSNQMSIDLEEAFRVNLSKKTNRDSNRHQTNPKLKQ